MQVLVQGREIRCSRQQTETWIGTPCRVRLDIYLVSYERKGGEVEGRGGERGGEREREERNRSCLFEKETEKRENSGWKLKISLSQQTGGSGHGLSLRDSIIPTSYDFFLIQ